VCIVGGCEKWLSPGRCLAELEKRHPTAENDNVIEFVLPPNDPKRKQ
jgi:hypothetical protein